MLVYEHNTSEITFKEFMTDMSGFMTTINSLSGEPKFKTLIEMLDYLKTNQIFFHNHPKLNNFRNLFQEKLKEFEQDVKKSTASEQQILTLQDYFEFFGKNFE
jgi:hypothetical protein